MRLSSPSTKRGRTQRVVLDLLAEHEADAYGLPTSIRFVFYELEQRGHAVKPSPEDQRRNRRRSHGWPPGQQDVTDALTDLREAGLIPWSWISDEMRSVSVWSHAASVGDYLLDRLSEATINPWHPQPPPLILAESRATAAALRPLAGDYACPIAGTGGNSSGFLRTMVAPLLADTLRPVLYLGDVDRCGYTIEANTRRVLEDATGSHLDWRRLGETEVSAIEPIWKVDGRDGKGHWAREIESLGQGGVVAVLRRELNALLAPLTLDSVREREEQQRTEVRRRLEAAS